MREPSSRRAARAWDEQLSVLRIKTNRPDVDRLVNDWLPYQLLGVAALGPHRPGAAFRRDRLSRPVAGRHPAHSSRAGARPRADSAARRASVSRRRRRKWWHRAPNGGTGLADRTHASDPHLWLPYVTIRYVKGTGDDGVLDAVETFLEANPVPKDQEGDATVPLKSRDKDTLLGHCARAIDYSLDRFGAHGLPLWARATGTTACISSARRGAASSVWLGFFLHGILVDIAPIFEAKGDKARADRYRERAESLRAALAELLARRPLRARLSPTTAGRFRR